MRKAFVSIFSAAVLMVTLLAGCGSAPTLPTLDLYSSSLSGTVEYLSEEGQSCRMVVVEGDSHYKEKKVVQVSYSSVKGKDTVSVGDSIRFDYNYIDNVTDYNGLPHITIEQVTVD